MCDLRFPRLNNKGLCKPRRVTKMVKKEIMNKNIFWVVFINPRLKNQTLFSLSKNLKVLKSIKKNLPKHASVIVAKKVVSASVQQVFDQKFQVFLVKINNF